LDKEGKIQEIAYGDPFSIANFLTTPVLKGLTQGLAVIIILGQILELLSMKGEKGYFFPTTLGDSDSVAPVPSSDGNGRGA
jgi:hypothetical protein